MQAIILAAGEGTRLRPFTMSKPKVMLPVGNKPILAYVVKALVENGLNDIIMVVGYRKERIMSFFGDGSKFGAKITYVVQEKQLGTAHALVHVKNLVKEDFVLVAGDNIIDKETVSRIIQHDNNPSVLVTESELPSKYGVITIENDRVTSITEKPERRIGNIINTGVYHFNKDIFQLMEEGVKAGKYGITQVLQGKIEDVRLEAVRTDGRWNDAVYPWDLIKLNETALDLHGQEISGMIDQGVTMKGPISIGAGSRIRAGTYLEGPIVIGEGCDIGPSVAIFPSTSIGNSVEIGPFTSIHNSIIMNNVRIGSHSHVGNAVIDDGVSIKGALSAFVGPAHVKVEGEFFKVEEIGTMIGEDTLICSRVVLTPGSIIGAGCRIGDGATVRGNLENKSVVI
jgi:UDP-N-acetylglucosamine diphosphorylase / glucose-1-phosphate thymidylyltransferase / UDP-N-acetylgalactosamine diphosphorylase / glucosamine-1-phosphate N-acetyltransferase / galactosamine-1-phosphate N-acetyltransferase